MSVLLLSCIGGIVSAVSTSLGSLLVPLIERFKRLRTHKLSLDFALGVMLSASIFSLIGPQLLEGKELKLVYSGLISGILFIFLTHRTIEYFNRDQKFNPYQILLVAALIFHNLPEGMGAGASLAGLRLSDAIPVQIALSIQNVVEGFIFTMLMLALKVKLPWAVLLGMLSGIVEMSGAVMAGLILEKTLATLPFFLAFAGASMMTSVFMEFHEAHHAKREIKKLHIFFGLLTIPIVSLFF